MDAGQSWRSVARNVPTSVWVGAIFLLALVIRVVFVLLDASIVLPFSDADWYRVVGRNLAEGNGFVLDDGTPTAFWPPGYAFALAAVTTVFGDSLTAAKLFNAVAGALTVIPVYGIGSRIFDRRTGLVAATLLAVLPSPIFWTPILFSETFFTLLFTGIIWLLTHLSSEEELRRPGRLVLLGLVIGAATLVRGQAMVLPVVALLYWLLVVGEPRRTIGRVAIVSAAALVLLAPWAVRNALTFDSPVLLSSNVGYNLYIGHNDQAIGRFRFPEELWDGPVVLPGGELQAQLNEEGWSRAWEYALHNPRQELTLIGKRLYWLLHSDSDSLLWIEAFGRTPLSSPDRREGLATLIDASYYGVLALALVGARLWFSWRERTWLLIPLILVLWFGAHLPFFGEPRFHLPVLPLIVILASRSLVVLWGGSGRVPESAGSRPDS